MYMYNKVIIMGRFTADPELTGTNVKRTNFLLAVPKNYKKEDGTRDTNFIRCKAWRNTAEFICKFFKKGQVILIEGELESSSYEKNGQTIYSTDVKVLDATFAGGAKKSDDTHDDAHDDINSELLSYYEDILSDGTEPF